jgi:hypothetical protein
LVVASIDFIINSIKYAVMGYRYFVEQALLAVIRKPSADSLVVFVVGFDLE